MLNIINWDNFICERNSYNKLTTNLSKIILRIINDNIGKLILHKNISIKNEINSSDNIFFSNDIINIKISNRNYGNMNPISITFKENEIIGLVINLETILTPSELISKKISSNNTIIDTIEHECLHVMERYLTYMNNSNFAISWKMGESLHQMNEKYKDCDVWEEVSHMIYLSLPHEMRAKLQQLNSSLERNQINGIENSIDFIKNTNIYKEVEFLSNIKPNLVLKKLKSDSNYTNIIKDFSVMFLENENKNYEKNFTDYMNKIVIKNKKLIDKLLRVSYNFENYEHQDRDIDYNQYI